MQPYRKTEGTNATQIGLLAGAGSLILLALAYRSKLTWIVAAIGACLAYRNVTREPQLPGGRGWTDIDDDRVQKASEQSFPASDPPGWTTGPSLQARGRG